MAIYQMLNLKTFLVHLKESIYYIPSPVININTTVNAVFTSDELNRAKSYVDITDW